MSHKMCMREIDCIRRLLKPVYVSAGMGVQLCIGMELLCFCVYMIAIIHIALSGWQFSLIRILSTAKTY